MKRVTNQGTKVAGVVALVAAAAVFAYALVQAVRVEPVDAGAPLQLEAAELPAGASAEPGWARGTGELAEAPREGSPVRLRANREVPSDAETRRVAEAMQEAASFRGRSTSTDELLDLAVANDPFRPDRRPGPAYVMPWERRTPPPQREEDEDDYEPEWPELRVVGFALTQNGGAALVQHDEDMPLLLAMGERIRGYELVEVDTLSGGGATLVGPAGQIRFPVREPRVDDDDRRRRRRGDDDDDDRRRALERREQQLQQVRDILQRRLRQQGGNAVIRLRGVGGGR